MKKILLFLIIISSLFIISCNNENDEEMVTIFNEYSFEKGFLEIKKYTDYELDGIYYIEDSESFINELKNIKGKVTNNDFDNEVSYEIMSLDLTFYSNHISIDCNIYEVEYNIEDHLEGFTYVDANNIKTLSFSDASIVTIEVLQYTYTISSSDKIETFLNDLNSVNYYEYNGFYADSKFTLNVGTTEIKVYPNDIFVIDGKAYKCVDFSMDFISMYKGNKVDSEGSGWLPWV